MTNIQIEAQADLEAAARYQELAERNPSLRRDYLKRAKEAERIGRAKLSIGDRDDDTSDDRNYISEVFGG